MSQRARTDAPPPPNMVYERSTPDARVATIDAPALGCSIALLEVARKWRRRRESDPAKSVRFVSDRHFWHFWYRRFVTAILEFSWLLSTKKVTAQ